MTRRIGKPGVISLIVGAIALIAVLERQLSSRNSASVATNTGQSGPNWPAPSERPGSANLDSGSAEPDRIILQADETDAQESQSGSELDLEWLREEAINDVLLEYSLMFKHLGLTNAEEKGLIDFLVEVWMSSTIMRNYRPEPIAEEDRRAAIGAIIGDAKLEKLLILERNKTEYREAGRVAVLLQANDVPLSDVQQDQLLGILIDVRGREQAVADPNAQQGTVEAVESQIATMNEYERLVLELAPSVLSSRQMELFFARYQNLSYQRAHMLELQKKSRANEDEEDDFPLGYPARN